jgi:two-component system chemotaxis sensor kinase CheA
VAAPPLLRLRRPPAAPVAATAASAKQPRSATSVRTRRRPRKNRSVSTPSSSTLLEVAGESVQAANQAAVLLERLMQFKFEGQAQTLMSTLAETLERASRYSTELQRATLATRMQPVGRLFQKFPRLVRELAKDLGKDVELNIEGAETEVDRVVVDSCTIRWCTCCVTRWTTAWKRRKSARCRQADQVLHPLKAWQEANSVMIVLQDDGKGMDPVKLRAKALQKGLIPNRRS